jgi:hypothetical protein
MNIYILKLWIIALVTTIINVTSFYTTVGLNSILPITTSTFTTSPRSTIHTISYLHHPLTGKHYFNSAKINSRTDLQMIWYEAIFGCQTIITIKKTELLIRRPKCIKKLVTVEKSS